MMIKGLLCKNLRICKLYIGNYFDRKFPHKMEILHKLSTAEKHLIVQRKTLIL